MDSRKAVYQDKTCIMFSVCLCDFLTGIVAAKPSMLLAYS